MELFSAFIIGLTGSLHCIGMCGPIFLSLPSNNESLINNLYGKLLYNLGRIFSYMTIGAIVGFIGNRLLLAGIQEYASIIFGIIIILSIGLPSSVKNKIVENLGLNFITNFIKKLFLGLFSSHNHSNMFVIGILNGFLPCGFVYVGAFGALTTGSIFTAMIYMFLFGLGTVPLILFFTLAGNYFTGKLKSYIRKAIPFLAVLMGIIFILRGMSLGIPFISPKLEKIIHKQERNIQKPVPATDTSASHSCCGN